ncbi:MAG: HTTM domain-containing protein [Myxococcales bacterium]|nr:HTTM domain-containing protein [Myxococcales bacterium]
MSERAGAWAAIERWFFDPIDARPLALVRIGLGLCLFSCYLLYIPHLEAIFGPEGLALAYYEAFAPRDPIAPDHLWLVHGLLLLSSASFTVGFRSRLSGFTLAACHAAFLDVTVMHTWGWSRMMVTFMLYVALANPGGCYSVDRWLAKRSGRERAGTTAAWPVRILMLHVAIIYLSAGWARLFDESWIRGEMIYVALNFSLYSRHLYLDLQSLKPILVVACWAAWAIEMAAPALLWPRRTRLPCVFGLMAMHLGLELTATIGFWQLMMISALCIFLPGDWVEARRHALWEWLRSGPEPSPAKTQP